MTTPKMDKSLAEIFDVDLTTTDKSNEDLALLAVIKDTESLEKQRDYVRKNLTKLISSGMTAVETMITIANSTEQAKDFKTVADMIQTVVDANVTLLNCEVAHKQEPAQTNGEGQKNTETSENAVFTGSTADFLAKIKKKSIDV